MSKITFNRHLAMDARRLLYIYYSNMGYPSGVIPSIHNVANQHTTGYKSYNFRGLPMNHLAVAKKMVEELRTIQIGQERVNEDTFALFQEIIQDLKQQGGYTGIYQVKDQLPRLISEKGGLGSYRLNKVLRAKRLVYLSKDEQQLELQNDRVEHFLVKHPVDPKLVYCNITHKSYELSRLVITE